MNFSTKTLKYTPVARNTPEAIAYRTEYVQWAARLEENSVVFIDESGFNLHTRRKRGRSRIGKMAAIETSNSKGNNISLLLAISPAHGIIHRFVKLGAIHSDDYAKFTREVLESPILQHSTHTIIQDNATIHTLLLTCFDGFSQEFPERCWIYQSCGSNLTIGSTHF